MNIFVLSQGNFLFFSSKGKEKYVCFNRCSHLKGVLYDTSRCIPYRLKQSVENRGGDWSNRLEVLMISSPNRHDLVFPKVKFYVHFSFKNLLFLILVFKYVEMISGWLGDRRECLWSSVSRSFRRSRSERNHQCRSITDVITITYDRGIPNVIRPLPYNMSNIHINSQFQILHIYIYRLRVIDSLNHVCIKIIV